MKTPAVGKSFPARRPVMVRPADQSSLSNRSVERAGRLLSAFTLEQPTLSFDVARSAYRAAQGAVHHLATALRASGLLTQAAEGGDALGVKLLQLGAVVRENL